MIKSRRVPAPKEKEVLNTYREIYNQGVEPKIFINDFLELLYYFKNINSLDIDGTNFSLNDEEFKKIQGHAEAGYKIVKNIVESDRIAYGVLYHHERVDGTGYPF